jgi:serine/threonine protein kinase/DNA-binding winged helix-turn-helix (wHTH) protein
MHQGSFDGQSPGLGCKSALFWCHTSPVVHFAIAMCPVEHAHSGRVRLGGFELDLKSGELRSLGAVNGEGKVLLREQPFQVLRMLIERGGKIATREEIKRKLWPNDTIVDFDHSINVAIGNLRRALGDSADNPQYIETLARRGYRLLVAAEWLRTTTELPRGAAAGTQPLLGLGDLVGKKVSHYRVLEVIGGGGMGMVYKAEDLKLGRRVALKFLPEELVNDPLTLQRFEREAQTASALNHPNICTIYAIEECEGQPFIVMELLEGSTLLHHLSQHESKAGQVSRLLDIAIQICNGLQAAHDQGIIHRDIKPANIFLTKQGPVKILDFGLAKLATTEEAEEICAPKSLDIPSQAAKLPSRETGAESSREVHGNLTSTGIAIGTAGYMSPEQVRKEKLDARTDLFSFGLVLYEMAAGRRAFTGETAAMLQDAILNQTPAPAHDLNPAVPRGLDTVINKALEKDRLRRYQSAAEMREDIERVRREAQPAVHLTQGWLAAAALLLVVVSGIWAYWRFRSRVTLSPSDTIVLAVSNQTGDPVFDDALNLALRVSLEQSPYLNVLAEDKVRGTLRALQLSQDAKVTPEIARNVCLQTNSKIVVASTITDAGNGLRIELKGLDCQSGVTVAQVRQDIASRSEVVHLLGVSAVQLRGKLGEPASSVAQFNKPLEQATSQSLEALQLLTEGYRHHLAADFRGALSYYQRATELDSDFALAYAALGSVYGGSTEFGASAAAETKAYQLRSRLTERSRFQVEDLYYEVVTGEQEKAYTVLSQWVQTFPDDFIAHSNLAGCLLRLGQPDRSLAEAREAARLLPSPWSYNAVIFGNILTDRLDDAKAAFDDSAVRKFDAPPMHVTRALLAFLEKDKPALQEQWSWAIGNVGNPASESLLLFARPSVETYYGRFRAARGLMEQGIAMERKTGSWHPTSEYDIVHALREAEVGNLARAQRAAEKVVEKVQGRDTQLALALVFARTGNIRQAQILADALNQSAPLDTVVQNHCLPTIRAAIKLQENDPAAAIAILRPTIKYDLADADSFNSLYPAYIRGLAFLQMGEGRLGGLEFQKLIDHPGRVEREVTGALSHLQLARAQKLMGDQVAARKSYEDFLTLWQDADSDIPIYQEAKAEYAKLRVSTNRIP